MDIDLGELREMHPRLPADLALVMVERAALALERNAHTPSLRLSLDLDRVLSSGMLSWPAADLSKIDRHDHNRITEDGAEAVALAVAIGIGNGASFAGCSVRNTRTGSLRTPAKVGAKRLLWR